MRRPDHGIRSTGSLSDRSGWFFLLLAFCLYFFFGISCILIVLISGLLGWLLCTWRVRKGGGMV